MSRAPNLDIDPDDPRAPPLDVQQRLSPEERAAIVDALPPEVPWELSPPEGDAHRLEKSRAISSLDGYFRKVGRRVYLSSELAVYYPGEARFSSDILAVVDVEPGPRDKWVVAAEGRGLDFVVEVLVRGDKAKDVTENVARYARLGIPEYFVFDKPRSRLLGYVLPSPRATAYQPILPQEARWPSRVLGLDLGIEGERLRFFAGTAGVPDADELLVRANATLSELLAKHDDAERRAHDAEQRAEDEKRRAQDEKRRAEELARRVAELEAELRRRGG